LSTQKVAFVKPKCYRNPSGCSNYINHNRKPRPNKNKQINKTPNEQEKNKKAQEEAGKMFVNTKCKTTKEHTMNGPPSFFQTSFCTDYDISRCIVVVVFFVGLLV